MAQEDKQLLLQDLCARLPYGVKVRRFVYTTPTDAIESVEFFNTYWLEEFYANKAEFKPYLRPMSSMTEEEYKDLCNSCTWLWFEDDLRTVTHGDYKCYDWLTVHHFDYRGLIEKSLAIVAPEGMYES